MKSRCFVTMTTLWHYTQTANTGRKMRCQNIRNIQYIFKSCLTKAKIMHLCMCFFNILYKLFLIVSSSVQLPLHICVYTEPFLLLCLEHLMFVNVWEDCSSSTYSQLNVIFFPSSISQRKTVRAGRNLSSDCYYELLEVGAGGERSKRISNLILDFTANLVQCTGVCYCVCVSYMHTHNGNFNMYHISVYVCCTLVFFSNGQTGKCLSLYVSCQDCSYSSQFGCRLPAQGHLVMPQGVQPRWDFFEKPLRHPDTNTVRAKFQHLCLWSGI